VTASTFKANGITCAGCATDIETVLKNTDGVINASVSYASNGIVVESRDLQSPGSGRGFARSPREVALFKGASGSCRRGLHYDDAEINEQQIMDTLKTLGLRVYVVA